MTARQDYPWLAAVCDDGGGYGEPEMILDELDTLHALVADQEQTLEEWAAHHARIQADFADLKAVIDL